MLQKIVRIETFFRLKFKVQVNQLSQLTIKIVSLSTLEFKKFVSLTEERK